VAERIKNASLAEEVANLQRTVATLQMQLAAKYAAVEMPTEGDADNDPGVPAGNDDTAGIGDQAEEEAEEDMEEEDEHSVASCEED